MAKLMEESDDLSMMQKRWLITFWWVEIGDHSSSRELELLIDVRSL